MYDLPIKLSSDSFQSFNFGYVPAVRTSNALEFKVFLTFISFPSCSWTLPVKKVNLHISIGMHAAFRSGYGCESYGLDFQAEWFARFEPGTPHRTLMAMTTYSVPVLRTTYHHYYLHSHTTFCVLCGRAVVGLNSRCHDVDGSRV